MVKMVLLERTAQTERRIIYILPTRTVLMERQAFRFLMELINCILASIRIPPRQIPLTRQNIRGVRLRARRELMENREEPTSLSRLVTC